MEQRSGAFRALYTVFVDLFVPWELPYLHTKKSLYANAQKVDSNHWDVNPPWI
jgi:hypothetical protein